MTNLVSVVMATYNGEKFIRRQLESILAQTHANLEVIVADDASSDTTVDIVAEYAKDPRVRLLAHRDRVGFVKNFERGLKAANGAYVAFSDQDDVWDKRHVESLLKHIGRHSLITSDLAAVDEDGRVLVESMKKNNGLLDWFGDETHRIALHFRLTATGNSSLFTVEVKNKSLPFPPGIEGHDWWIAHTAVRMGGIGYTPEVLTKYTRHRGNVSSFINNDSMLRRIFRYLKPSMLRGWLEERKKLRRLLEWSLGSGLDKTSEEKKVLIVCLNYTVALLGRSVTFNNFSDAFRYRKYLFTKPLFFWAEAAMYLVDRMGIYRWIRP